MKHLILLASIILSGCAFSGLSDTCDIETGEGCTTLAMNLEDAANKGQSRKETINPTDISMQEEYTDMDRQLLTDEYRRAAPRSMAAKALESTEVKIRIYPYSDGSHFYDSRDVYILIQRDGWARGAVAYTPSGTISLARDIQEGVGVDTDTPKDLGLPSSLTTTGDLHVRTGASIMFDVIHILDKGDTVKPIAKRGRWWQVEVKVKGEMVTGWVHGGWVKE
jgi:uncharacterized protein YgiM (DUF1202 family)